MQACLKYCFQETRRGTEIRLCIITRIGLRTGYCCYVHEPETCRRQISEMNTKTRRVVTFTGRAVHPA